MRVALFGAGWVVVSVVLAGLVFTAAAISRARRDDSPDDTAAILEEVGG